MAIDIDNKIGNIVTSINDLDTQLVERTLPLRKRDRPHEYKIQNDKNRAGYVNCYSHC